MNKIWMILGCLLLVLGCQQAPEPKEVSGTLQLGHEVRAFRDNADNKEYWLIDKSGQLIQQYLQALQTDIINYQPVYAKLLVRDIGRMSDGFGAE